MLEPGLLQGGEARDKACRHRIDACVYRTALLRGPAAAPLELMIVGIARDMAAKTALLNQPRLTRK